jgi:hypothetical protein
MASNQSKSHNDLFDMDSLLTLEDTLYTTAYNMGISDGARAGRIEGRIFGLEKGFEKFAALGELYGRSAVWGARALIPNTATASVSTLNTDTTKKDEGQKEMMIPKLPENQRLLNNITLLHSLTDPLTFSTDNTEEAVADFDDRVKRAGAKAKVIERIAGEMSKSPDGSPAQGKTRNVKMNEAKKGDDSMEDFAGSKLLR